MQKREIRKTPCLAFPCLAKRDGERETGGAMMMLMEEMLMERC